MSTYAGERRLGENGIAAAWRRGLDALLAAELHTSLEFWLYTGLVTVALVMRFSDLGTRALHHDESLHAAFSYYLRTGKGYQHDPLMHGPLLFHITALVYFLFGASDATSRFAPALMGSGLVLLPLLLRPWLGRVGAFAAAAFIAFSPSLLYYSRFIRHDPFVVIFTLGLFICIFRYRATQRFGWLVAAAALLSLSFASMEITFIIAAILLVYLDGSTAADLSARIADQRQMPAFARGALFVALLPVAWLAVCVWPLIEPLRRRYGLEEMPADAVLLLVLGLLSAPQFSAAIRVPLKLVHYDILAGPGYHVFGRVLLTRMEAVGGLTVIALLATSIVIGSWWNQKRWLILAAVFYVPYFLLYTTFLTNRAGWGSGIWGALSYWLDQQNVNRGAQPAFYYSMTVPTYEYLVLGFAAVGLVIQSWRRGLNSFVLLLFSFGLAGLVLPLVNNSFGNKASIPVVVAAIGCAILSMHGNRTRQFLLFYFAAMFFGLSVAGEKMPWLTEHLALPLALLAGMTVNDIFGWTVRLPARARSLSAAVLCVCALIGAAVAAVLASKIDGNVLRVGAVILAITLLLVSIVWLAQRLGVSSVRSTAAQPSARLAVAGMVGAAAMLGLFGMLTLRNDWRMNWVHPDTPDEMLIYTQTSPDVPKLAKEIDRLALESGEGHQLRITVDSNDSFTWPWAWYLRDYPNTSYPDLSIYGSNPSSAANINPGSVLLLNASDQAVVSQFPGLYGPGERFHHRWWFPENYKQTSATSFLSWVRNGSIFNTWWRYITNRDGFSVPPSDVSPGQRSVGVPALGGAASVGGARVALGSVDAVAFFPASWVPGMGLTGSSAPGTASAAPAAKVSGSTLTFGVPGLAAGQLRHPSGVAADASGNVFVADTLNNRVEKFDTAGNFVAQAGGSGANQLNQPWDLAVAPDGTVFVADTWNHRVVKLDRDLKQVATWGRPADPASALSPLDLYGPRSIAVDRDGNVWITDTGNARVIKYDPNGIPLGTVGTRGTGPGQFDEPVGITAAPNGDIYVADTWNNRIQWFDTSLAFRGQLRVSVWANAEGGRDAENKPYLAVLPDGSLLTTYPSADRLVEYDTQGTVVRSLDALPGMTDKLKRPLGIALTADGKLILSDSLSSQIIELPLADLLKP